MNIKGGYILQPRAIEESDVSFSPPHVREIWNYLLRNANSSDVKYKGYNLKRGQLFRSYQDIRDALSWKVGYRKERYSEGQTKGAMKFLRDSQRITTSKQLGGVLITICNYEYYQNPKNYETTNEETNVPTNEYPMPNQPPADNNKNEKNNKNDNKEDILQSNDCPPEEKVVEEKPKKKSTRTKKTEPSDKDTQLNSEARKIFEARYLRETREKYYWQDKDAGNMTRLLNALKHQRAEKGLSNENNTDILAALSMFINIAVKDEWIKKKLSVSILFSQFNGIVARAKAEEQKLKSTGNYGVK